MSATLRVIQLLWPGPGRNGMTTEKKFLFPWFYRLFLVRGCVFCNTVTVIRWKKIGEIKEISKIIFVIKYVR